MLCIIQSKKFNFGRNFRKRIDNMGLLKNNNILKALYSNFKLLVLADLAGVFYVKFG